MGNSESAPNFAAPTGFDATKLSDGADPSSSIREISHLESAVLRKRIEAGVQYNMRILLRGERGSGKTSLFRRFQGLGFTQQYLPTPEIQTTTINWTLKKDDTSSVKVEVWDVVDKGFVPPGAVDMAVSKGKVITSTPSARSVTQGKHRFGALDASAVDVYKSVQTVIFVINPFSPKALNYIRDEIEDVPGGISVVLLLNFRDRVGKSGATSSKPAAAAAAKGVVVPAGAGAKAATFAATLAYIQQCKADVEKYTTECHTIDSVIELQREIQDSEGADRRSVHILEVSTLNCFGLKELHRYLSLPYLGMKMNTLRVQMDHLMAERLACEKELRDSIIKSVYYEFASQFETRQVQAAGGANGSNLGPGTLGGAASPGPAAAMDSSPAASRAATTTDPAGSQEACSALVTAAAAEAMAVEEEKPQFLRTAHRKSRHEEARDSHANPLFKKNSAEWEGFLDEDDGDDRLEMSFKKQQPVKGRKSRGGLPAGMEIGGEDYPPPGVKARGGLTRVVKGRRKEKGTSREQPAEEEADDKEGEPRAGHGDEEREEVRKESVTSQGPIQGEVHVVKAAGEAKDSSEDVKEMDAKVAESAHAYGAPEPAPEVEHDDVGEAPNGVAVQEEGKEAKSVPEDGNEGNEDNEGMVEIEEKGREEEEDEELVETAITHEAEAEMLPPTTRSVPDDSQSESITQATPGDTSEPALFFTAKPSAEESFFAEDDDKSVSPASSVSTTPINSRQGNHSISLGNRKPSARKDLVSSDSDCDNRTGFQGKVNGSGIYAGNNSSDDSESGGRQCKLNASTGSLHSALSSSSMTAHRGSTNSLHSLHTSTSTEALEDVELDMLPSKAKALDDFFDGDSDSDESCDHGVPSKPSAPNKPTAVCKSRSAAFEGAYAAASTAPAPADSTAAAALISAQAVPQTAPRSNGSASKCISLTQTLTDASKGSSSALSEAARVAIASAMVNMNNDSAGAAWGSQSSKPPAVESGIIADIDEDDVDIDELMGASRGHDIRTDGGFGDDENSYKKKLVVRKEKSRKARLVIKKIPDDLDDEEMARKPSSLKKKGKKTAAHTSDL